MITADECKKILKKISKTAKFFTHSVKSLSEEVEGYLSHHYSLTIRYIEDDIPKKTELFMKEQPKDNGFLTEMAKSLNAYQKENFVYSIYEDLEKMKNFEPFAAKCYYFRDDLLVLDNLKYEGYAVTDRNVLYNLDECKAALKTLAFYHSAFIGNYQTSRRTFLIAFPFQVTKKRRVAKPEGCFAGTRNIPESLKISFTTSKKTALWGSFWELPRS